MKLDQAQVRQFLQALHGDYFSKNQGHFLEVRHKAEGEAMQTVFYPTPDALLKAMPAWKQNHNYWPGVAPRSNNRSGTKTDVAAMPAIYADIDWGTEGHAKPSPYQTKEAAQAAVEQCPFKPSILVDTGGGLQPHWKLKEPIRPENGNLERVEWVLKGFAKALKGDSLNAATILRLPGTSNMKLAGEPRPVKLVYCHPERTYTLDELEQWAKPFIEQEQDPGSGNGQGSRLSGHEAYAQAALTAELTKLARAPHQGQGRNIQLNDSAFALGQLIGAGVLDRASVEAGLYGTALSIGLTEREIRATIRSGIEAGMKQPRKLPDRQSAPATDQKGGEPDKIPWIGHNYFVKRGRLCLETYDREGMPKTSYLANFQARITEEITRDDGLRAVKEFSVKGSLDTGQALPPAQIQAREFDSLAWVRREWGAAASQAPGRSFGPHLVNAIQAHSQGLKRRTVFSHSGWRKIGGVWRYLHGGGAIGPGGEVEVDLGGEPGPLSFDRPWRAGGGPG